VCHGSEGGILAPLPEEPCCCLIAGLGGLQESVQGCQGRTVPLLDPASSDPDLLLQGYGGLEHIGALGEEGVQLSEVGELVLRIEPAVSQAPAEQGPVLLSTGQLSFPHRSGNGRWLRTVVRAAKTRTCARLGTGTISVHPEQRSVTVRVVQWSPATFPPS